MSVVNFAAAKAEREPRWEGKVRCVGCQHEWEGSAPMGTMWLECPACGLPKGTPKHPFGAALGDLFFACLCGCEALTAYKRKDRFYLRCMGCGADQTNAIFGEP